MALDDHDPDCGYHKTITLTLLAPSPSPPFALSPFRLKFERMPKPDKNDNGLTLSESIGQKTLAKTRRIDGTLPVMDVGHNG